MAPLCSPIQRHRSQPRLATSKSLVLIASLAHTLALSRSLLLSLHTHLPFSLALDALFGPARGKVSFPLLFPRLAPSPGSLSWLLLTLGKFSFPSLVPCPMDEPTIHGSVGGCVVCVSCVGLCCVSVFCNKLCGSVLCVCCVSVLCGCVLCVCCVGLWVGVLSVLCG